MKALMKAWLEEPGRGEYLFLAVCTVIAVVMIFFAVVVAR